MFIQKLASGVSDDIQKYIMIIHLWGNFFEVYGYGVFMFSYLLTIKSYKMKHINVFLDSSITKITNKLTDLK